MCSKTNCCEIKCHRSVARVVAIVGTRTELDKFLLGEIGFMCVVGVGGVRRWVSGEGEKGKCTYIPANMAEEEVAKLIVGNDSGMCKASFAGDVPRMFSLIKNSFCV